MVDFSGLLGGVFLDYGLQLEIYLSVTRTISVPKWPSSYICIVLAYR